MLLLFNHLLFFEEILPKDVQPELGRASERLLVYSLAPVLKGEPGFSEQGWQDSWICCGQSGSQGRGLSRNALLKHSSLFGKSPSSGSLGGAKLYFLKTRQPVHIGLSLQAQLKYLLFSSLRDFHLGQGRVEIPPWVDWTY